MGVSCGLGCVAGARDAEHSGKRKRQKLKEIRKWTKRKTYLMLIQEGGGCCDSGQGEERGRANPNETFVQSSIVTAARRVLNVWW